MQLDPGAYGHVVADQTAFVHACTSMHPYERSDPDVSEDRGALINDGERVPAQNPD